MRRLSPALLTMLMLGVIGLLVALYFGKKLFAKAEAPPTDELINIPMALTDLEPGTKITEAHVGLGKAYASNISRDVVRTNRVLVGRVVKTAITAAQPISTFDLYPVGQTPAPKIAPGLRAVTISMDDSNVINGVIQPGQFVDVHFTPSVVPGGRNRGGMTMTLFKGVEVEAINGNSIATDAAGRASTVTMELTPEQANIILLAKDKGQLNLVYNPEGKGLGTIALDDADRATLDQILGLKEEEPEKEKDPAYVTETYSGAGRRLQQFRDGLRTDRYAIERLDYNNRNRNGNGWNRFGNFGDAPMPDFEFQGGNGNYFSVPSGAAGGQGANNNGQINNGQSDNGQTNGGQNGFGGNAGFSAEG